MEAAAAEAAAVAAEAPVAVVAEVAEEAVAGGAEGSLRGAGHTQNAAPNAPRPPARGTRVAVLPARTSRTRSRAVFRTFTNRLRLPAMENILCRLPRFAIRNTA